ncbi:chemokine-like receptor 1 [Protopterus annectens]|uniref:chemokine-like receptor 1 n=1 Tax=Protopterus annectens TaxID=7888 RepID=UPI001CF9B976|nr:chemokine-like receptor 1 [Protopterus annectens]
MLGLESEVNESCTTNPEFQHGVKISTWIFILGSSLIFLLGVAGNGVVIWMLSRHVKRTEITVWFLNLSVADFIYTVMVPFRIIYAALVFHWPFGEFLCKLDFFVAFFNMYASVLFLTAISLDRCFLVTLPIWHRNKRPQHTSLVGIIAIWLISFALSTPYIPFIQIVDINKTICYINYRSSTLGNEDVGAQKINRERIMVITRFVLGYLIPSIVLISTYTILSMKVHKMQLKKISKVYKITIATVVAFFICWTPYHVFNLIYIVHFSSPACSYHPVVYIGYPVVYTFAYTSSCINPILYVFFGEGFKKKLFQTLTATFQKAFEDEVSSTISIRKRPTQLWSRRKAQATVPQDQPLSAVHVPDL